MTDAEERLANNVAALYELETNLHAMVDDEMIRGLIAEEQALRELEVAIQNNIIEVEADGGVTHGTLMDDIYALEEEITDSITTILRKYVGSG